jgi:peroxiredoxin
LQKLLDAELGGKVTVIAIAPEPVEKLAEMARKVQQGAGKSTGIVFLSDADHTTIDAYGLLNETAAARGRFLPHPTTYVLDAKGIVRWKFTEVDYKIRPTNAMVLAEVRKAQAR